MTRNFLRVVAGVILFCAPARLPSSSVTVVAAGDDLQAALDSASPGDTITLQAGATFTGNFILPKKDGNDYITITSSQADALTPGARVQPSDSVNMAKIMTANGASALATAPGAHHYRLVGLEFRPSEGLYVNDLLDLGDALATSVADLAHDITVDRAYIHGDPVMGSKRGIGLNSVSTTIENCYISDFKSTYQDAQAIAGWNGPGPYTIENNYLEGSGENILFGGSAPGIPNLVPSDITIRRNYLYKPLSWKQDDPSYAGTLWSVKNSLELKNAQRVEVSGNIFENNWAQSQNGYALVLTVRLQGGLSAVVENVMFRNNIVRHTASAVNIQGMDDLSNNQGLTKNLTFSNNLFEDVDGKKWGGGAGYLFQILNGAQNITIEHNTGLQTATLIVADQAPSPGLIYQNNITPLFGYAIFSSRGSGIIALDDYFPGWVCSSNVFPGYANNGKPGYPLHPLSNFYPATLGDVGFIDLLAGNYRLASTSLFKAKSSDGKDPGADMDAIEAATATVISGARSDVQRTLGPSAN